MYRESTKINLLYQDFTRPDLESTCAFLKEIIFDMTDQERRQFLRWCTAREQISDTITICPAWGEGSQGFKMLPVASTCGSTIAVLPYTNKQQLRKDLEICFSWLDEQMFGDYTHDEFIARPIG